MASLAAHLAASLFLFPIGLRRLHSSSSLYLTNPSLFRSKSWYFSLSKSNNIDFYFLLLALPIAIFSQFFKFAFFHQSATILVFWVLLILIVVRENVDPFLISDSFVFLFAGIAFLVEFSVIGKGIDGISGSVYGWFGELTLLCAGSCLYLSVRPSAFFADFLLSSGLIFKGTWILQAGLNLYTDVFTLRGCQSLSVSLVQDQVDLKCDLGDNGTRGVAVIDFIFTVHAIVILALDLLVFGLLSSYRNSSGAGEARGPLLALLDSESLTMCPTSEFEL